MITIDLHDYYPHCPKESFVEVSTEVAAVLAMFEREEIAHKVKEYRHKAYYSLDALDGIEEKALIQPEIPLETIEREFDDALLYRAIARLPEKQARRIYARYVLGKGVAEIARLENRHHKSVAESIRRALISMAKYFEEK